MTTSFISPPLLRPTMLLVSICTAALSLTACETDSTDTTSAQSAAIQTTATNTPSAVASSMTLNYSATASSAQPTTQYLVGSGKADITDAAAETGMFGYAAGQVVQGINDRSSIRSCVYNR